MGLLNKFFVSYDIIKGPTILYLNRLQIGRIHFHPSKKNIFTKQNGFVWIYDNRDVEFSSQIKNFLIYTAEPQEYFRDVCINIWEEEYGKIR